MMNSINSSYIFCDTPLWDYNTVWNTSTPHMTQCFSQTVIPLLPLISVSLVISFDIYYIHKRLGHYRHRIPRQCIYIFNLALIFASIIITKTRLVFALLHFIKNELHIYSNLLEPIFQLISHLLILVLVIKFCRKGRRISVFQPIFWSINTICLSIRLLSNFDNRNELIMQSIQLFISILALFISCIPLKTSSFISLNDNESKYCPLDDMNIFSRFFYVWIYELLIRCYKTRLNPDIHLKQLCYYLKSENASQRFKKSDEMCDQSMGQRKKLMLNIWKTMWIPYSSCIFEIIVITLTFVQPLILAKLMDFVSEDSLDLNEWHGVVYGLSYSLFALISRTIEAHINAFLNIASNRVKIALMSSIYEKMLKLSPSARREYTSGELNNFMSVDSEEITVFIEFSKHLISAPISLIIGVYMLWQVLSFTSLNLFLVIVIITPLTSYVMRKSDTLWKHQMILKDKRIKQLSEILNNIKMLKLFAWEKPFMDRITKVREQEVKKLKLISYWSSANNILWSSAPMIVAAVCFSSYTLIYSSKEFSAKTAFISLYIFNILRYPMGIFPTVLSILVRANVSLKRLSQFLSAEELNTSNTSNSCSDENSIEIKDADFNWDMNEDSTLKEIDIIIPKGSLVAIVGRVGSGKSSLFSAILGDMYQTNGTKCISGTISYVPQTAWIQNKSLRNNIIFISQYDQNKYKQIINCCALQPDIETFPAEDLSEIGEKGINLSGGQKQRVSLARALYQDSDIYLMDDPLASVDAHVAQHLFHNVIGPNGWLKNKTRLLATHQISFLKEVKHIFVMKSGRIIGYGTYDELNSKGLLSEEIYGTNTLNSEQSSQIQLKKQISVENKEMHSQNDLNLNSGQLIDKEYQELGEIKLSVYLNYIRSCGLLIFMITVMANLLFNFCETGANYWLNLWTSQNTTQLNDSWNRDYHLIVYVMAIILESFFVALGVVTIYRGALKAATDYHKDMTLSILRSPLAFFESTPMGRIINRFSADISKIDEGIPMNFMFFIQTVCWLPFVYIIVFYINLYLGFVLTIIAFLYYILYRLYLATSRQLKRIQSTTCSPVYSHLNESISGAESIRAYNVQQFFINESNNRVDTNTNASIHQYWCSTWFEIWTGILGAFITLSFGIFVVIGRKEFTPSLVGFILVYGLEMTNAFAWTILCCSNLETNMVAVERVREYSQLDSEAEWESIQSFKPSNEWPNCGRIDFCDYSTTYRPGLNCVLQDLNLSIKGGEKVGIVGRTGAGKSSLTLSLFRIIEPTNGRIIIDGIDISKIGLHDLRSKLTIIPQEPSLFAGSLRLNLDPFNEYTDQEIWIALKNSHMNEFVSSLMDGLHYEITEGANNLSAGQKQLLCLSRALLRDSKILVLDEATAACDSDTDQLIQNTIRDNFSNCTVLTIAHRLNTVLDYDRILVLSNGRLVESGSPKLLITKTDSIFHELAKESSIIF